MNPMLLKIVTSLLDCAVNLQSNFDSAVKSDGKKSLSFAEQFNAAQKKSLRETNRPVLPGLSPYKNQQAFYLDSLKKALLSQGKPFNKVSIKNEDLPLVKDYLFKCGFSQEKIDRLFKDLLDNNPNGEINLSRLFQKISQIDAPKNKKQDRHLLEPAAIPHLESILRGFGLPAQELDSAFSTARIEDGRLDLEKVVLKLGRMTNLQNKKEPISTGLELDRRLADKLKMLGVDIPQQGSNGKITLKEFMSSLEKAVGMTDVENKLPNEIKTAMDQILSKVVVSDEKTETAISKTGAGKPIDKESLMSSLSNNAKSASESVLFAPFKEQSIAADQKELWPSSRNKNKPAVKDSLLSSTKKTGKTKENQKLTGFINEKGGPSSNSEQQNTASANRSEEAGVFAKVNLGRDLIHEAKQHNHALKSESNANHMSQPSSGSTFSETIHSAQQNQKPAQEFLPSYLTDQIAKKISAAVLRADRVIRLQLKPPELGTVKIEMDIKDNVLKLEMITESSSVKDLLLSNVHQLKDALLNQGIKIEDLAVQVNHGFNHSMANSEQNLKERQKFIQESDRGLSTTTTHMDDPVSGLLNRTSGNHQLNLVA